MIWVSLAFGGELVLFGPGTEAPRNLEGAQPLSRLRLPGDAAVWIGDGGTATLCAGARQSPAAISEAVKKGQSHLDYGEDVAAREAFATAEQFLACADDRVDSDTLWDLYFHAGVLAGQAGDESEAVRLFRAGGLAKPSGSWNDQYNPDIQRMYLKGREAAAATQRVKFDLRDPDKAVSDVFVDGAEWTGGDVTADVHLLQVRTGLGQVVSMRLEVTGPVTALTPGAVQPVLLEAADADIGAVVALLRHTSQRTKSDTIRIVNTDSGQVRVWDGTRLTEAGKSRGPATDGADSGIAVLGGVLLYPDEAATLVGPSAVLVGTIGVGGELSVDLGAHVAFAPLGDFATLLPLVRAGVRYGIGDGYIGLVGTGIPHAHRSFGVGGAAVGGLATASGFTFDLLTGWNGTATVSAAAGYRF